MPPEHIPIVEHFVALFATENTRVVCDFHGLLHGSVPFKIIQNRRLERVAKVIQTFRRGTFRIPCDNQLPAVFVHGGDPVGRNVFLDDVGVFEDILGANDAPVVLCAGHVLLVVYLDPENRCKRIM